MNVKEAILKRKSIRAFLDKPVDFEIIKEILDVAKRAPSAVNTQPWEIYIVTGEKQKEICKRYTDNLMSGKEINPDFPDFGYPKKWKNPFMRRKRINGLQLYKALGIKEITEDEVKKNWANNYNSFGAPITIIFTIDEIFTPAAMIDYGTFIQNINLVALEYGLGTCTQGSWAEYPGEIREVLEVPPEKKIMLGLSVGYIDETNPVNQYETPREDLDKFVTFVE